MKIVNKLIRDKIPEMNDKNWVEYEIEIESWEDLENRFFDKMLEEIAEIKESKNINEIADFLEVLHWYTKFKWYSFEEVENIRKKKFDERWWFEKWVILLKVWNYKE
jgi:predicted house-cleaning noncanonical NTP pyrophosphatase (MazG superfamily)